MLDSWLQDVRYAARLLRRNPLFALTAALSLAIGIGANTTIFTIANALLFKPPAGVVEPGRLVDVGRSQDGQGFDNGSYPNYLDIRARNTVFTGIYAYQLGAEPMSLGGATAPSGSTATWSSTNYFNVLGARPRRSAGCSRPTTASSRARRRSRCSATSSGCAASTAIPPSSGRRCS